MTLSQVPTTTRYSPMFPPAVLTRKPTLASTTFNSRGASRAAWVEWYSEVTLDKMTHKKNTLVPCFFFKKTTLAIQIWGSVGISIQTLFRIIDPLMCDADTTFLNNSIFYLTSHFPCVCCQLAVLFILATLHITGPAWHNRDVLELRFAFMAILGTWWRSSGG